MSEETSAPSNGLRNGIILAIFALLSTGLTSITWVMTKAQIQAEKEKALLRAISELVPAKMYSNDPYNDCTLLTDQHLLGTTKSQQAWRLRDSSGNAVAALITSIAPNGYNGAIEILVGHYAQSPTELAGVRVTQHQETPGLGDKINTNKSDWIKQFAGIKTDNNQAKYWLVKKDGGQFDAFTGATITPRAVLAAIGKNIDYFNLHQQAIFNAPANCSVAEQSEELGNITNE